MARHYIIFLLCLLPFCLYQTNSGQGPDSSVYLDVATRIVTDGHLNTLPKQLTPDRAWQITQSKHAPIHQNIGGTIFFLPATALALVSHRAAGFFPPLPERLHDFDYHQRLWVGSTAYLLALFCCLLTYQVGRCYFPASAILAALLSCLYGGPLLIYTAIFPGQTNLPAAFLAALLLYLYHFSNLEKRRSWLLLGAVWGLGVFVRFEFAVWGIFLLYAILATRPPGRNGWWRAVGWAITAAGGALLFIIPGGMIRQVIFGTPGSTYGIQFDLEFLKQSTLMLLGTRNGLFTFWPVLLVALLGYLLKWRENTAFFHSLFAILVLECLICGSTIFWSGEFGASFGQRRFLVVLPCFILFLGRLFTLARRYSPWLMALCAACAIWGLAMYGVYGRAWSLADNTVGFLMPYHFSYLFSALTTCAGLLPEVIGALVFLPKHADMLWLFPLFAFVCLGGYYLIRPWQGHQFTIGLGVLVCMGCAATLFLAGARQRGENAFAEIARANPGVGFITRNYEIDNEIIGSMVDAVSFFLELHHEDTARYFSDKTLSFLAVEAPEQTANFQQMTEGLWLRQALGWYRLVPEQSHDGLLAWYRLAQLYNQNGQPIPDISGQFAY